MIAVIVPSFSAAIIIATRHGPLDGSDGSLSGSGGSMMARAA
jgi:hypothetical protein